MMRPRILESPQKDPDNDLLGMAPYAEKLAGFLTGVAPPFTLGIYGEWGDGKTTFVNFLQRYLNAVHGAANVKFIEFSAWPHSASDAVWRALMVRIAQDLYDIPPDKDETDIAVPAPASGHAGLWPLVADFLASDALVLNGPSKPDDPHAEYKKLVAQLDRTAYGSISKSADQQLELNHEVALMTIVNGAITALGTVSPLVAQLRTLFGMQSKIDLSELLHTEKNAATRNMIESVNDFKKVFRELFAKKAGDRKVFVFVDDLDRCLPDVALDVLEAIKIFFDEKVPCTFIVAADESLIGQGLRLRYKALAEGGDPAQTQAFFTQKGQEYFEKIIQFGVRVPPRTAAQAHTFISAQFPQWTAASDIIQTAIGSNPRRLKQYCNLLSYKHTVAQIQPRALGLPVRVRADEWMDELALQLLDKLIALYSWSPQCLRSLERIAGRDGFGEVVGRIEAALSRSEEDKPLPHEETQCDGEGCYELYEACVHSAPLFSLMQVQPLISESTPEVIRTLAKLADVSPQPEIILDTSDPSFARILKRLARDGSLSIEELTVEDLTKLIAFAEELPALFELMHELAQTEDWFNQMAALELRLARPGNGATTELTPQANALYEKLNALDESLNAEPLSRRFLSEPRFSTMLPLEVLAFVSIRHSLPRAEKLLSEQFLDVASPIEKYRRVAREATHLFKEEDKRALQTALGMRRDAAAHFLELRKFAKLDALAFKWPQLSQHLRMDGAGILKALEAAVLEPGPAFDDRALANYLRDEQLVRFLRLRPLFKEIYQDEITKYFAVSQAVAKPPQAVMAVSQGQTLPPTEAAEFAPYDNLMVTIQPNADAIRIGLTLNGNSLPEHNFNLMSEEIESIFASLGTSTYEYAPATRNVRAAVRAVDAASLYQDVGAKIFDMFFGADEMRKVLHETLLSRPRVRLALDLRVPELAQLPWECLYLQHAQVFLGLAQKYSIVRHVMDGTILALRTLAPPLKILVAAAMPKNVPYIETGREVEMLKRALTESVDKGQVVLQVLDPPTLSELQSALRRFRPHLFHFIGHGAYLTDQQSGALMFEDENRNSVPVNALALQTLLTDSNVSLAVLNACETGASRTNEVVTGVAGALVHHGIPAAIATMRPVEDPAAVMFTREFYRSFVDGYPLEAALVEARKALSVEKWDWTAYALFASTLNLEALRLLPKARGAEAA